MVTHLHVNENVLFEIICTCIISQQSFGHREVTSRYCTVYQLPLAKAKVAPIIAAAV